MVGVGDRSHIGLNADTVEEVGCSDSGQRDMATLQDRGIIAL